MHISRNLYDIKDEVLQTHMKEGVDIGETLAYYIADLCAIQHLVRAQLEALTELAGIFANNALDASKGYNQNIVRLPLRLQEAQHNRIVTDALKMVIDERKAFADHVLPLLGEARKTQQYLGGRHMHLAAEKHAAHAKMSAESMSLFTIVTTVFLPLTFFTSYFALNPAEAIVKTEFDFWKYSGPPTVVFALFTLYIVLFKKYKSGEYTEDRKVVQWLKSIFKWTHSSEPQADPEMALQGSGALRGEGTMEFETQDGGVGGRRSLRG
ncbi:hypothetical protein BZA05DRAFT_412914 [Tricharina praecox]|uniref:uncharacterized protein n=1 Tax=Tricharina praecox TaxID=43433 RepID=UPI00221FAEC9|nr:uncharacterized protein BZA05DRAFT_412914 [Tricharina praecox]KAI5841680.1 hypothetical protein BZA05DRAFT_412914 [Tricharina praecox]